MGGTKMTKKSAIISLVLAAAGLVTAANADEAQVTTMHIPNNSNNFFFIFQSPFDDCGELESFFVLLFGQSCPSSNDMPITLHF